MSKMIIIAGPQAAGKSTAVTQLSSQACSIAPLFLGKRAPLLFPLQESRQIIVHKHMLLGAIFMTLEHELEVVNCDLERMDLILQRDQHHFVYVDEGNIFTLAHAAAHGITEAGRYWDSYVARLTRLNTAVIFLDVPPDVSWDRRQRRYEQRLAYFPESQREAIRQQYREYLGKLSPLLLDLYRRLPFPKVTIDGCSSKENVIAEVFQSVADFTMDSRE
jgi:thymidylate kinase